MKVSFIVDEKKIDYIVFIYYLYRSVYAMLYYMFKSPHRRFEWILIGREENPENIEKASLEWMWCQKNERKRRENEKRNLAGD